jgi:hypothetical protein
LGTWRPADDDHGQMLAGRESISVHDRLPLIVVSPGA